jgi:hypothetical protein
VTGGGGQQQHGAGDPAELAQERTFQHDIFEP